jgi:transformation/transcription domain-associated protein
MLSYLAYNMRFSGEQSEGYAENLILSALRLLQDCPSNGIALRKVTAFLICDHMVL